MHVAIVVKEFPPDAIGGTETQTKRMAAALAGRDHDVTVFTKRYGDHDDESLPFDVVRVPNLTGNPFLSTMTFLVACTVMLSRRAREFDVCQCMMVYPNGFLGYVVRRLTGLPYFAWIRGGDYYFMKDTRWKRWMIRRVLADTRVLVQASDIAADISQDFPGLDTDLAVLGNGVEIPDETAGGEGILFVGRLAPMKGVDTLLRAMEGIDAPLTIVGDGPERDRLVGLADDLDIEVNFEGRIPPEEVDEYYRDAAVFCLPSTGEEGLPNVVLEAMSWGLPCVTTDSGGLPSLIEDRERGFVVPQGDPPGLRDRLRRLLDSQELREDIGLNAREYVTANHSWEVIVDRLETQYAAVAGDQAVEGSTRSPQNS